MGYDLYFVEAKSWNSGIFNKKKRKSIGGSIEKKLDIPFTPILDLYFWRHTNKKKSVILQRRTLAT